jgi:hypothetical protein
MEDSARLPVGRAFAATWAFIAERWLDIILIVWLPSALGTALTYVLAPRLMDSLVTLMSAGSEPDPAVAGPALQSLAVAGIGLALATAIANLIAVAGLLKLLIRGEKPGLPFYIAFGRDELLMLAGWALMVGIMFGVVFAGSLILVFARLGFGSLPAAGGVITVVVYIAMFCVICWILARTSLANPAAVSRRKIGLGPSWRATEGQTWLMIGYWALWTVPIFGLQMVAGAVFGTGGPPPGAAQPTTPEEIQQMQAEAFRQAAAVYHLNDAADWGRLAFTFLLTAVLNLLVALAAGVAWRMMTDPPPEAQANEFA